MSTPFPSERRVLAPRQLASFLHSVILAGEAWSADDEDIYLASCDALEAERALSEKRRQALAELVAVARTYAVEEHAYALRAAIALVDAFPSLTTETP